MRLLVVLHHFVGRGGGARHYYSNRPEEKQNRIASLSACLAGLKNTFGRARSSAHFHDDTFTLDPLEAPYTLDIKLAVTGDCHVLDKLPQALLADVEVIEARDLASPLHLGFFARALLLQGGSAYDFAGQIEDDIILSDPEFFAKLAYVNQSRPNENILVVPNRHESWNGRKCYIDGRCTAGGDPVALNLGSQQGPKQFLLPHLANIVTFHRADNPYSGAYFLSREQLCRVAADPRSFAHDASWTSPLESSMILHLVQHFALYKPALASGFLEVQHYGSRYVAGQHLR